MYGKDGIKARIYTQGDWAAGPKWQNWKAIFVQVSGLHGGHFLLTSDVSCCLEHSRPWCVLRAASYLRHLQILLVFRWVAFWWIKSYLYIWFILIWATRARKLLLPDDFISFLWQQSLAMQWRFKMSPNVVSIPRESHLHRWVIWPFTVPAGLYVNNWPHTSFKASAYYRGPSFHCTENSVLEHLLHTCARLEIPA